ncbi:hypothetical protein [Streptomyces sp. ALB3]|uniref:hypothetical protein n=1 Tax=Streptomyces sp. ALB3 TaxID=3374278 RepID=UPI0037B78872
MHAVLPGMRAIGEAPFVNHDSAVRPRPDGAGTWTTFAAQGAYSAMLDDGLAPDHVLVAT